MRLARAVTLFAAGAATAWYLDRRRPDLERAVAPPPTPAPPPATPVPTEAQEQAPRAEQQREEPPAGPPPPPSPRRGPPPVPEGRPRRREVFSPPDEAFAGPSEQPTIEQPALQRGTEPADVAAVVDDLIASADSQDEPSIVDAEVVEEKVSVSRPDDPRVTVAVLVELGRVPGLRPEAVAVEVTDGVVWLHGEIEDPALIVEVERRIAALEGVQRLRSLLHLPLSRAV